MLEYCDYIAKRVQLGIEEAIETGMGMLLTKVSRPGSDLHPTEGWLQSTKKTLTVEDRNGQKYRITVECLENDNA